MSLFDAIEKQNRRRAAPLPERMRPERLADFVGQGHFLGPDKLLTRLLAADRLGSVIFYGPPGTGKTTLARLLATEARCSFFQLNAVTSGVKELREVIERAQDRLAAESQRTLLFVDEIHRFNKAQQDVLLPHVEDGTLVLVGATTQNPFFALTSALVSRSRVFQFQPLTAEDLAVLVRRALVDEANGLGTVRAAIDEDALAFLVEVSDGDARRALSTLEIAVLSSPQRPLVISRALIADSMQRRSVEYDRDGDSHYDSASALIKSIRGSDPDAGLYWLARMLEGGEDVRFLTRRLVILASEDIGNADPRALTLAVAAMQACEFVGLPECQYALAQAVTYLACAPKSNAATVAIGQAIGDIREGRILPVPVYLRDRHYGGAEQLGHGQGYQYSHNSPDAISTQDYLGVEREYYRPTNRGYEAELSKRLEEVRRRRRGGG